ncbi:VWA domain-containing protein [Candidatus Uabimicrobium sp. HlEnr_7]|uniref:VWA domain-containing protein n=1 Tax=Candidatus Uabimicrobium helgolandensis TaxID=3095367 RepID=UPI0035576956
MEFIYPSLLILLFPPMLLFLYKILRKSWSKSLILWLITITFVVVAISLPVWKYQKKQRQTIVCCIDTSLSISPQEMQDFLTLPIHKKWSSSENDIHFILFGDELSIHKKFPKKISPTSNFSVLEEALQGALALIRRNKNPGKIIVYSDGTEQILSSEVLGKYQSQKIPIFAITPSERTREFYFDKLSISPQLYPRERPEFTLNYRSTFFGSVRVRVLANQKPYIMRDIVVQKGKNNITFSGNILSPGDYFFEATIDANDRPQNNKGFAATTIIKQPTVLIIGQVNNDYLAQSLAFYNIKTTTHFNARVSYDAIVVINRKQLSSKMNTFLQKYLEQGGSVLWIGQGNSSWLPGMYVPQKKKDPPVNDKTPKENKKPKSDNKKPRKIQARSAAFVFIIDRSESMKGEKLQLAQQSALETISRLWIKDSIGVIAFDVEPNWIIPLGPIVSFDWAQKRLSQISSQGGGTIIKSALEMAFTKLRRIPTHIKHIILLTDGFGDVLSRGTIVKMVNEMNDSNISVTTIGVGEFLDEPLLSAIAHEGEGSFYITEDHLNIRALVVKDVDRILKIRGPIPKNEQPKENKIKLPNIPDFNKPEKEPKKDSKKYFTVDKTAATPIFAKFQKFPGIKKYNHYKTKRNSKVELVVRETKEPLLLQWNWKLGRVMLWAGEYETWQEWQKYPQFCSTLTYNLLAKNVDTPHALLEIEEITGRGAKLLLTVTPPQNYTIISSQKFLQVSATKWSAFVPHNGKPQKIDVVVKKKEQVVARATTTFAPPYKKEYKNLAINNLLWSEVCEQTGGARITNDDSKIFALSFIEDRYPLQNIFLWCSLFLIFLLIFSAMRKL